MPYDEDMKPKALATLLAAKLLVALPAAAQEKALPDGGAAVASPQVHDRHALVDGRRVHYVDAGPRAAREEAEALVLVHGWASSVVTWRHQLPALATQARVLAVDLPGHGKSETPERDYSMSLFADAVVAVMDDAGVRRAVLVGHSNGTPVALNVVRAHADRVLGLVAIDGALKSPMSPEQAEAVFAPFREEGWRDALRAMVDGMPGPGLSEKDRAAIREMALATPHEAVVGGFVAAVDPAAWSDEPIDVPLLLVLARQPAWSPVYEEWVRERSPGVDYRVWTDVGHYLHMERPDDFRAALEEFLDHNDLLQP